MLVIDIQGQLAHLMHEKDKLFHSVKRLIKAFQILEIPIIITEQAPAKIGKTIPEITDAFNGEIVIEKLSFSCLGEEQFLKEMKKVARKEVVVCGIETHVCIMQTVLDLLKENYRVQVVTDAISSRSIHHTQVALGRMKSFGADLTTGEMVICELLKTATHKNFKDVMRLIK